MANIQILIRTNRRSLSISVNSNCEVIVKAPRSLSLAEIQKLVDKKEDWIRLQISRIQKNQELNRNILNYNDIMFCGNIYHTLFDNRAKEIILNDTYCVVPEKFKEKDKFIRKMTAWYKKVAKQILTNRVNYFCDLMQLEPYEIKLTNAKTCWGTCNSKGVVSLNWRLVFLPHNLIDYVIVHELAHLVQLNHSKLFWQVVASVLPDYTSRKNDLKQGGFLLGLFR